MVDSLDLWHSALAEAHRRKVRVLVIADSMGELSFGYRKVWESIHQMVTLTHMGTWSPPRAMDGEYPWALLPGEPADIGIEARGQLLRREDGPAGLVAEVPVPSTVDVYYTARPDGAPLAVVVDDTTVLTIDTSRDERGEPVTRPVFGQRGRTPEVVGARVWQLSVVGPGVAAVEAVCLPPVVGIEVHGTGRSGVPTRRLLDAGCALGHLDAMVARGEPPDLVVWASDTSDQSRTFQAAPIEEALDATRRIAPSAAIAHYVPTGHNDREDWADWAEAFRAIDRSRGVIVLDGFKALGDVSRTGAGSQYSRDGAHLNPEGQELMDRWWIDTLVPPGFERIDRITSWRRGLASAQVRPARVVVVSDGVGERAEGFRDVWARFADDVSAELGWWSTPFAGGGASGWELSGGEPADVGLDCRGVLLRRGDGPAGSTTPRVVPTTLDLYYTARPDGSPLEVRVGGTPVGTVDTSLDESGCPVSEPKPAQRWRFDPLAGASSRPGELSWEVEVVGSGVAAIEAVCAPPARGIEVHGLGREGHSTEAVLASGQALAHMEAMVARGEAPDLVIWAADTSSPEDRSAAATATNEALLRTRSLLPGASIASYVPPVHRDGPEWWLRLVVLHMVAERNEAVVVDGAGALGDVGVGAAQAHHSIDLHELGPEGREVLVDAFVTALTPP